jgi:PhnB protein
MPKRSTKEPRRPLAEQVDEVISAMLVSLRPRPEAAPHRDLASLLQVAQVLRNLPREEFRVALKTKLQRSTTMNEATRTAPSHAETAPHYLRPGVTSITPYIIIERAPEFIDFLKAAFGAQERIRVPRPDGTIMHAELGLGNAAVEVADANDKYTSSPTDIHLYFDDCDAVFQRALAAGATSIFAPTDDHPSGDRWGAVRDPFGNVWDIATPKGWTPGPEGIRTVQPYLHLKDAAKMIPFAAAAFGAQELGTHKSPDGKILHSTLRIGNATFEIDEAHGEYQPKPCHLHIYVPSTDDTYANALRAGATSLQAPYDAPYGDRAAGVKDPFGNSWYIATFLGEK